MNESAYKLRFKNGQAKQEKQIETKVEHNGTNSL